MLNKKRLLTVLVVLGTTLIVSGAVFYFFLFNKKASNISSNLSRAEVDMLTLYDWWTSSSESAAINALIDFFIEKYPNTAVMPTSVVGGAGYSMLNIVEPLVSARQVPDSFQMHAGYEVVPYIKAGLLDTVDDIWESENLSAVIPSVIQDMNRFDGHYYSVPIDIHRVNLVWYNNQVLRDNKIDAESLKTWDDFFAVCDKLRAAGIKYPIQMGESWTAVHVFEQIAASEGMDFYQDFINGKIVLADDPRLLNILNNFKKYLSYVNPDNSELSWVDAVSRVKSGEGVFNIMGDWAGQEFKMAGKVYDVDYGVFPVPGTENSYGLCVDTFQRPRNISHPTNANRWLKIISSKEGQDIFNPLKGSIPVRTDSDISKYDTYQQSAISDFWKAKYIYPSIVYGSGAPQSFKAKLEDVISSFIENGDVNKAAMTLANYVTVISGEYTIIWSLK